jgi:2-iminobutanoate/2-iminopropanoate deaminase
MAHLTDLNNAPIYNRVYAEFFPGDKPARTTVGSQLLGGFLVEIDVVAYTGD